MHGDLGRDLRPEAGVAHRHHGLLGVAVHVHVQHEAAEGGSEVVGQAVVKHAAQDQVHGQLAGDLVDGQVLSVQTHLGKEVELAPAEPQRDVGWGSVIQYFALLGFFSPKRKPS